MSECLLTAAQVARMLGVSTDWVYVQSRLARSRRSLWDATCGTGRRLSSNGSKIVSKGAPHVRKT